MQPELSDADVAVTAFWMCRNQFCLARASVDEHASLSELRQSLKSLPQSNIDDGAFVGLLSAQVERFYLLGRISDLISRRSSEAVPNDLFNLELSDIIAGLQACIAVQLGQGELQYSVPHKDFLYHSSLENRIIRMRWQLLNDDDLALENVLLMEEAVEIGGRSGSRASRASTDTVASSATASTGSTAVMASITDGGATLSTASAASGATYTTDWLGASVPMAWLPSCFGIANCRHSFEVGRGKSRSINVRFKYSEAQHFDHRDQPVTSIHLTPITPPIDALKCLFRTRRCLGGPGPYNAWACANADRVAAAAAYMDLNGLQVFKRPRQLSAKSAGSANFPFLASVDAAGASFMIQLHFPGDPTSHTFGTYDNKSAVLLARDVALVALKRLGLFDHPCAFPHAMVDINKLLDDTLESYMAEELSVLDSMPGLDVPEPTDRDTDTDESNEDDDAVSAQGCSEPAEENLVTLLRASIFNGEWHEWVEANAWRFAGCIDPARNFPGVKYRVANDTSNIDGSASPTTAHVLAQKSVEQPNTESLSGTYFCRTDVRITHAKLLVNLGRYPSKAGVVLARDVVAAAVVKLQLPAAASLQLRHAWLPEAASCIDAFLAEAIPKLRQNASMLASSCNGFSNTSASAASDGDDNAGGSSSFLSKKRKRGRITATSGASIHDELLPANGSGPVFCLCEEAETSHIDGDPSIHGYVLCSVCNEWLHPACMGLLWDTCATAEDEEFTCNPCGGYAFEPPLDGSYLHKRLATHEARQSTEHEPDGDAAYDSVAEPIYDRSRLDGASSAAAGAADIPPAQDSTLALDAEASASTSTPMSRNRRGHSHRRRSRTAMYSTATYDGSADVGSLQPQPSAQSYQVDSGILDGDAAAGRGCASTATASASQSMIAVSPPPVRGPSGSELSVLAAFGFSLADIQNPDPCVSLLHGAPSHAVAGAAHDVVMSGDVDDGGGASPSGTAAAADVLLPSVKIATTGDADEDWHDDRDSDDDDGLEDFEPLNDAALLGLRAMMASPPPLQRHEGPAMLRMPWPASSKANLKWGCPIDGCLHKSSHSAQFLAAHCRSRHNVELVEELTGTIELVPEFQLVDADVNPHHIEPGEGAYHAWARINGGSLEGVDVDPQSLLSSYAVTRMPNGRWKAVVAVPAITATPAGNSTVTALHSRPGKSAKSKTEYTAYVDCGTYATFAQAVVAHDLCIRIAGMDENRHGILPATGRADEKMQAAVMAGWQQIAAELAAGSAGEPAPKAGSAVHKRPRYLSAAQPRILDDENVLSAPGAHQNAQGGESAVGAAGGVPAVESIVGADGGTAAHVGIDLPDAGGAGAESSCSDSDVGMPATTALDSSGVPAPDTPSVNAGIDTGMGDGPDSRGDGGGSADNGALDEGACSTFGTTVHGSDNAAASAAGSSSSSSSKPQPSAAALTEQVRLDVLKGWFTSNGVFKAWIALPTSQSLVDNVAEPLNLTFGRITRSADGAGDASSSSSGAGSTVHYLLRSSVKINRGSTKVFYLKFDTWHQVLLAMEVMDALLKLNRSGYESGGYSKPILAGDPPAFDAAVQLTINSVLQCYMRDFDRCALLGLKWHVPSSTKKVRQSMSIFWPNAGELAAGAKGNASDTSTGFGWIKSRFAAGAVYSRWACDNATHFCQYVDGSRQYSNIEHRHARVLQQNKQVLQDTTAGSSAASPSLQAGSSSSSSVSTSDVLQAGSSSTASPSDVLQAGSCDDAGALFSPPGIANGDLAANDSCSGSNDARNSSAWPVFCVSFRTKKFGSYPSFAAAVLAREVALVAMRRLNCLGAVKSCLELPQAHDAIGRLLDETCPDDAIAKMPHGASAVSSACPAGSAAGEHTDGGPHEPGSGLAASAADDAVDASNPQASGGRRRGKQGDVAPPVSQLDALSRQFWAKPPGPYHQWAGEHATEFEHAVEDRAYPHVLALQPKPAVARVQIAAGEGALNLPGGAAHATVPATATASSSSDASVLASGATVDGSVQAIIAPTASSTSGSSVGAQPVDPPSGPTVAYRVRFNCGSGPAMVNFGTYLNKSTAIVAREMVVLALQRLGVAQKTPELPAAHDAINKLLDETLADLVPASLPLVSATVVSAADADVIAPAHAAIPDLRSRWSHVASVFRNDGKLRTWTIDHSADFELPFSAAKRCPQVALHRGRFVVQFRLQKIAGKDCGIVSFGTYPQLAQAVLAREIAAMALSRLKIAEKSLVLPAAHDAINKLLDETMSILEPAPAGHASDDATGSSGSAPANAAAGSATSADAPADDDVDLVSNGAPEDVTAPSDDTTVL